MYSYYDTSEFLNAPYGAEYLEQGIALLNQVLQLIEPRSGRNNLFRPLRGLILL